MVSKENIGIYIHVPFCTRKCDYCHFYVIRHNEELVPQYLEGLASEWPLHKERFAGKQIDSIYFGGGTPSLLPPDAIAGAIAAAYALAAPAPGGVEITLEANPERITPLSMAAFAAAGINRVSIGVQAFDNTILRRLGRQHSGEEAYDAVLSTVAAGITNISIDLMYDLPEQTMAQWENALDRAILLPITHLSLYNLTIEPDTAFFRKKELLQRLMPNELLSASLYSLAIERLCVAGFKHYEISAFAKSGCASRHNSGYWSGKPFLGLGPSAFSYWQGSRWRNVSSLQKYNTKLAAGLSPIDFNEALPPEARNRELLAIALRLLDGVDLQAFAAQHGALDETTIESIQQLIALGFLEKSPSTDRLALTRRGIFCYDAVAVELI